MTNSEISERRTNVVCWFLSSRHGGRRPPDYGG